MSFAQQVGNMLQGYLGSNNRTNAAENVREEEQQIILEAKEKLDPVTILALLALMRFKEEGSRITFSYNLKVFIQQPSDYTYFGVPLLPAVRGLKRQSCKDTCIVEIAIRKAALWHQPQKEGNEVYKTLFESARSGLESLVETYKKKEDTELTRSGLNGWINLITDVTTKGVADPGELDEKAQKVKALWEIADIQKINMLIAQMIQKQGATSIEKEVKCREEIEQLEFLLEQKYIGLKKIWE